MQMLATWFIILMLWFSHTHISRSSLFWDSWGRHRASRYTELRLWIFVLAAFKLLETMLKQLPEPKIFSPPLTGQWLCELAWHVHIMINITNVLRNHRWLVQWHENIYLPIFQGVWVQHTQQCFSPISFKMKWKKKNKTKTVDVLMALRASESIYFNQKKTVKIPWN